MGPLRGIRILEFAGIGPGPFAGMMLADMGAEVLRIDRSQGVRSPAPAEPPLDLLGRGRRSAGFDLKHPEARAAALRLVEQRIATLPLAATAQIFSARTRDGLDELQRTLEKILAEARPG